ncbi:MYND finger protein [Gregarina niphandrodes]|uniref:MYND finger protein n=1 Tax=Gregarina niphandrodes TaxID=110365 RepID=A0A023AXS2_GRENI|nr:MYND finger protein [Gregarina niphandrodes]EZG43457.1 MYND finger protein [Gregarina niphandrodes]|eukprot:XP_011133308.1 MYND finger protein [Gregarina niphandrodes]
MLGGLTLVLLFNIGCTKSGASFLYDHGSEVLEITNNVYDRFSDAEVLHCLIAGLVECIIAGTPTDVQVLSQVNPKRVKHYNQILRCGCCGRIAEGSRKLKICGECHLTRYCGRACQQEDWKEYHSKACKAAPNV